jgi:hypothetical protein
MIDSKGFKVTHDGEINATEGDIAGWKITDDRIDKKDANGNSLVGLYSGDQENYPSLIKVPMYGNKTLSGTFKVDFSGTGGYKYYIVDTADYVEEIIESKTQPALGDNNLIFHQTQVYANEGRIYIKYSGYFKGQSDGIAYYNITYKTKIGET